MWADMDAGVTLHTFFRIKSHFSICSHRQSAGRTLFYTGAALHAQLSGFRVVTIFAVNVTALQKNGCPVSRTIHTTEWDDPVYYCFHLAHLSEPLRERLGCFAHHLPGEDIADRVHQ